MTCAICQDFTLEPHQDAVILTSEDLEFSVGPFHAQWPFSMKIAYRTHILEWHDIPCDRRPNVAMQLYAAEATVFKASGCQSINVVKFANQCRHLHWHMIPRWDDELLRKQNPWELPNIRFSEIFTNATRESLSTFQSQIELTRDRLKPWLIKSLANGWGDL